MTSSDPTVFGPPHPADSWLDLMERGHALGLVDEAHLESARRAVAHHRDRFDWLHLRLEVNHPSGRRFFGALAYDWWESHSPHFGGAPTPVTEPVPGPRVWPSPWAQTLPVPRDYQRAFIVNSIRKTTP